MAVVNAIPKLRSRRDGAAVPLDELDRRLLNLLQGKFPLEPRPFLRVAELAEVAEEEVLDVVALDGSVRVEDLQVVDTPLSRGGVVAFADVVAALLDGRPGASVVVRLERHPDAS